jgi:hypothetical protein
MYFTFLNRLDRYGQAAEKEMKAWQIDGQE